ncbi:hypothetical protein Pmar_PMAR022132 [Perkinsus marinus ATCC 50983]|uniref:Uncharacterized protein n=1 Tax=Perkinsus marinus (strain ATCC 50983 / TXsc) TaxID=423536 RepID=C5L0P2_PERM5|nr:hypothetical protein Pmar_PMAR022132 [Perkinsus marinus ATCC 50983]EER09694.1 hypothetical protein Pmar_PMAR022132 [Perkinsus marinus ATCC 50983]|eukprot:XP_002777899.1 hypothetical protein Pmar_PMAR022132 [Perkinsus marinus ATCC 50983]
MPNDQYFEEFTAKMLFWAVLLGEGEEEEEEEEEGSKYGKLASTLDIMHTETSQRERAFRTNWTAAAATTEEYYATCRARHAIIIIIESWTSL